MKLTNEDSTLLLGRLADSIDGILDAQMSTALHNLVEGGAAASGDLAERDMAFLLGRIFREGTTGRLRVRRDMVEKSIYFEAGHPVMAASDDVSDRMLAMLVREGALDARQKDETLRVVNATGRKVGAVLIDLGFLRSDELLPAIRRHYESVILSLFFWSDGSWQIDPDVTAGPERTRLLRHPAALVREGLGQAGYTDEQVANCLGSGKRVFLLDSSAEAADIAAHAIVKKSETRVPMFFDGVRSLDEVARGSGIPESVVLRIALTLSCFGVLRPVEAGTGVSGRLAPRDLSIARERVLAHYGLAMESDYFGVLGVDRSADVHGIRRAYDRSCGEIAPETLGPDLWHELKQQIETIREVLDEGLRILSTPTLRSAYEFNLSDGPDAAGDADQRSVAAHPSLLRRF